jgi:hypothetical protein
MSPTVVSIRFASTRRPVNYATLVSLDLLHAITLSSVRAIVVVHEALFYIYIYISLFFSSSQRELFSDRTISRLQKEMSIEDHQKVYGLSGMMGR